MLFAHRIDAIAGVSWGILFTACQYGYQQENFGTPLILNTDSGWLFLSKKTATDELMKKLKVITEKLIQNGDVQQIIDTYLKE